MLTVDQRGFKAALHQAITLFEEHRDFREFHDALAYIFQNNRHYIHVENCRHVLLEWVRQGRLERARQFIDHIPDTTASRLVVALQLSVMVGAVLFVLALVAGLAIFLWQHFFG